MPEILFFFSVVLIVHAYFGYPLSLLLIGALRGKEVKKGSLVPSLTFIITAHNEEKRIQKKLENTLRLVYPRDKLQVIVASDGSTDRTNEIVQRYHNEGIEVLELTERKGKEHAQKVAVGQAKNEIVVFTDVATMLDPDCPHHIVSNFADSSVGCVSSEDRLIRNDGKPSGESLYVRYEMWLRRLESRVNTLVGLSGSLFAVRKGLCEDFSGEMQSDFRMVLNCVGAGLRAVSDPKVIGYYQDVEEEKQEFDRKVRTVLRGLTVFFQHLHFLNILKYGLFSYQYFCHKLLRWSVPFLLVIAFLANILLATKSSLYLFLLLTQSSFYILGIGGMIWSIPFFKTLFKIPGYFLTVNASILFAWLQYFKGKRVVMWVPTER